MYFICLYCSRLLQWHRSNLEIVLVPLRKPWMTMRWRQNEHDSVSKHQPYDCLFNRLLRCRSKKTPKLCVTGLCAGNLSVTGEFPAQRACNAENVSIWWRHHDIPEINHWQTTTKHKTAWISCKIRGVYFVWVYFVNLREAACRILIRTNVCD